ncbi:SDR family oxidoreductase [Streptomyces sp. TLI_171]|uniref:SDR family oxidoreductase n=1 Tax=Streptomyces sp. TLI_171 TaxID=1938859 RepID=UPI000C1A0C71|nr:SDR family oxidoreductase [Streptomyces sp. TLI_171]RKE17396.1 NADP-dependent 3-hydroxy acid dehydrogenase YdfG [Streptomyces sp. TLI_171]
MGTHFLTGAGSGIGAAVAELLCGRGEQLWLLARDESAAARLRERFPGSRTVAADLAEPAALAGALAAAALPERIDSLLHVAGVADYGPVADSAAAQWAETLAVNLLAPAELTRLLLPAVRTARGHVVFLNSGAGLHAPPGLAAYAASKFALKALAESLRAEEHVHRVRVTTVFPGEVDTPMQRRLHERFGMAYDAAAYLSPRSVAAAVATVLDHPHDGTLSDLMIRPNG